MNPSERRYSQPEKNIVRERIISASVTALTTERASSPVVPTEAFLKTLDYASRCLAEHSGTFVADDLKPHVSDWLALHASRVGTRKPSELRVLFLAGPDPTNDLMEFRKCGVAYENIWAIESDKDMFGLAVKALERQGIRVKLHRGNLHSFFSLVPQQFDIVYFDATAPLFGGEHNTIHVIRELVLKQRLTPLSVLVTNFAEANKDGKSAEVWEKRLGTWAYANGTIDTWTETFQEFVDDQITPQIPQAYGEFITKFLIRFCSQLVPWWRVVALPGAKREFFSDQAKLGQAAQSAAGTVELFGHPLYPLFRTVLFASEFLDEGDIMSRLLFKEPLESAKLADAVKFVSLIRTFYEQHFDGVFCSTQHILDACSPELASVLNSFQWFDQRHRIFCDTPLPNLITDLLLGLYGFPYHANVQKLQRFAYKAKETVMFTDIMVLDQARYMYDLLPTLPLFDMNFSLSQQLVLRACMDSLHRHCHYGCKDLFWGCALAGMGEDGFTFWLPPVRESVGDPGVTFQKPDADGRETC
jgi:hypothetical protein